MIIENNAVFWWRYTGIFVVGLAISLQISQVLHPTLFPNLEEKIHFLSKLELRRRHLYFFLKNESSYRQNYLSFHSQFLRCLGEKESAMTIWITNTWVYSLFCNSVSEILCYYHKHLRVTTLRVGTGLGSWF